MAVAAIVRALVLFVAFVSGASVGTTSVPAAGYSYDASVDSRVEAQTRGLSDASVSPVDGTCDGFGSRSPAARACATTPASASVATEAAPGARFVVNSAGDALDTARMTIPDGKFGYLLENPSKAGVFRDSMGFDQASLDPALRSHLVDNFGGATPSVPIPGGGTKFTVTGPMTGPSGAKWTITSVWGVDPDGTIRLITATP